MRGAVPWACRASFLALLAPLAPGGWFEGTGTPLNPKGLMVNARFELLSSPAQDPLKCESN